VQNTASHCFIACCLGAIKPQEKLEVGDPAVGPEDSILSGAASFGAPRRQAYPSGMSHPLGLVLLLKT
jgi:hypothetical protein